MTVPLQAAAPLQVKADTGSSADRPGAPARRLGFGVAGGTSTPRRAWQALRAALPSAALAKAGHKAATTQAGGGAGAPSRKSAEGFVSFNFIEAGSGWAGWREHGAAPERPRVVKAAAGDKPSVMGLLNPSYLGSMRKLPVNPGTVSSGTEAFVRAAQGQRG